MAATAATPASKPAWPGWLAAWTQCLTHGTARHAARTRDQWACARSLRIASTRSATCSGRPSCAAGSCACGARLPFVKEQRLRAHAGKSEREPLHHESHKSCTRTQNTNGRSKVPIGPRPITTRNATLPRATQRRATYTQCARLRQVCIHERTPITPYVSWACIAVTRTGSVQRSNSDR